jgi:FkbM family methyltransferase
LLPADRYSLAADCFGWFAVERCLFRADRLNAMSKLKQLILRQMRRKVFQRLWEQLAHLTIVGRNHWATDLRTSGELHLLDTMAGRLGPGAMILDVGANEGQYALEAATRLKPRAIYSFEPSSAAFSRLCKRVEETGYSQIIMPQRTAVGERAGEAILHSSQAGATIGSLLPLRTPYEPFREREDEPVAIITLDEFCRHYDIDNIDLLKIDVEGFEYKVLTGAEGLLRSRAIKNIQFEFGEAHIDARVYLRDFFDLLHADYEIYRVVADGLRLIPSYRPELEVFASINYFATLRYR